LRFLLTQVDELLTKSGVEIHRYWDLREIVPEVSWANRSEDDLLDELDEVLMQSVKQRMISDVPFGAFLSGGIDSSLMVAMMGKHLSAPIKTFTIGFEERAYDESPDARAVAEFLGTEHHCEHLSVDNLLDLMPDFLHHYDEPYLREVSARDSLFPDMDYRIFQKGPRA